MPKPISKYINCYPALCTCREDGEDFTSTLLLVLDKCYGIRAEGVWANTCVVVEYHDKVYWLNNNGGKIGIGLVNHPRCGEDVPTTAHHLPLDAGTVAYRIAQRIRGAEIDWTFRDPQMIDTARALLTQYLPSRS